MTILTKPLDFAVPDELQAPGPVERRGLARDDVRLMVAQLSKGIAAEGRFHQLPAWLEPGDALIVNTSRTLPSAIDASTASGTHLRVHFAAPIADGRWSVEVRTPRSSGSQPGPSLEPQDLDLEGGIELRLLDRHPGSARLWDAEILGTNDVTTHLATYGKPIKYLPGPTWPISDYQTVYAREPGSAEMPSAGRPFTTGLITRLVAMGVAVLPVTLHTGVSSYEEGEAPGAERFDVPRPTALVANTLRRAGGRVIAVGTTVVRALESVVDKSGLLHPGHGVTEIVISPSNPPTTVDGLITGWHEPRSSHLRLLEAIAGRALLDQCYARAVESGYLWHEFGDSLLILR